MKATVQYGDFKGTVAADISDGLGGIAGDNLDALARVFKLDEERYKMVGLSFYGLDHQYISLICVDKDQSTDNKEHIVSMSYDMGEKKNIIELLFKRIHIVLHDRHDRKYSELEADEEVRYSEHHQI